jgi:hypothetical protein
MQKTLKQIGALNRSTNRVSIRTAHKSKLSRAVKERMLKRFGKLDA